MSTCVVERCRFLPHMKMVVFHITQHIVSLVQILQHLPVNPGHRPSSLDGGPGPIPTPTGGGGTAYQQINDFVANLQQFAHILGFTVFLLCETVAGIMYMVSLNSDHSRAKALQAITTAIIGFVFLLLANGISNLLTGAFK